MKKYFPGLLLLLLFHLPLQAQYEQYAAAIDSGRALIKQFMQFNSIPGASVSVAVDGEIVWSEGFGFADLEQQVPVRASRTKFRIGSVSKPLAAAALGRLYDEQKIKLDTAVQAYVPDFPEKRWPITLRQLGGHLAGIRHYRGEEFLSSRRYNSVQEGLRIFSADTLLFEPGTRYSYTSYGWNLISAAIEGASGQDFLTFMEREVFKPLGMEETKADYTDSLIAFRSRFYTLTQRGQPINAPFVDNSYKWAGGGFLSTTEDLVRFGSAHLQGGFLSDTTLQLWQTSQKTTAGEETGYGIGWAVGHDGTGNRWVGHGGGSVGGITQLIAYPKDKVVVAMLTNSDRVSYGDIHLQMAHLFLPEGFDYPAPDEQAGQLSGTYQLVGEEFTVLIFQKAGRLYFSRGNDLPEILTPLEDGSYTTLSGRINIRFGAEAGGLELQVKGQANVLVGVRQ